MSENRPEDFLSYLKRKIGEIEELVLIAKDHPDIVSAISITDTIVMVPQTGAKLPILRINLELNEQRLKELRKKI